MNIRIGAAALLVFLAAAEAQSQNKDTSSVEARAARLRRGAGLSIGSWALVDDPATGSTKTSDSPVAEAFWRKGMDKHLVVETGIGFFRRVVETPPSGGLGGSPGGSTTAVVLPQMTSIKLFPFTEPSAAFEPFISGGLGFTLGFESESGGGGLLGGGGGAGALIIGVGGALNAGAEWRFSKAFGLSLGGHYTYLQFFEELAGEKLYRGTGAKVGMTYRFQY